MIRSHDRNVPSNDFNCSPLPGLANGRIRSKGPDKEVIDSTGDRSEDGPQNAEDDYPACSAPRLLIGRGLPLPRRNRFVHGPVPPLDLDQFYPSIETALMPLNYNMILKGYDYLGVLCGQMLQNHPCVRIPEGRTQLRSDLANAGGTLV